MNNKVIIAIVIIIILILAVITLVSSTDQQPVDQDQMNDEDTTQEEDSGSMEEAESENDTDSADASSEEAENGQMAGGEIVTVTYTDDGFQPANATVNVGDTVEFINESSEEMWVASDNHPTHALYQETSRSEHCADGSGPDAFDQCSTGDSYSFTFDSVGEWGYHNHVSSSDIGTIVVTQ